MRKMLSKHSEEKFSMDEGSLKNEKSDFRVFSTLFPFIKILFSI